jgi:ADP-heptose:LPS heptosyltransferase
MKILLAKRRAMGDTVLLSSSVDLLARSLPEAEISVLVPATFRPLLDRHPGIRHSWSFEQGRVGLLHEIRRERFDHLFLLHASPSSRWLSWLAGARASHFHPQNRKTEAAYGKHPNALEWDAFCFRSVFGDRILLPSKDPVIHLSAEEKSEGRGYWERFGAEPGRVVFLGLGASRATKRWLPRHFARLAELLRDRQDLIPAFVTGPGEEEEDFAGRVLNELRAKGLRPMDGSGKGEFVHGAGLGLRELAGALSVVRAYVGNDSGPKHMAVAVGVPTITLFGPEDPVEWHPYSRERHRVHFLEGLACRREDHGRWCGIPSCEEESGEQHRCMRDLDPLDVFRSLELSR